MKNAFAVGIAALVVGSLWRWELLVVAIVLLILLPPSWDPAVRFKEWMRAR